MPSIRRIAVGLGLAFVLSAPGGESFAQGPAGPGGGGGVARMVGTPGGVNYLMILMNPAVQEELKMADDQKLKIFELARESQQKGRERMQMMLRGASNPQMFMQAGARIRQENEAAAGKLLKSEQKERIDQIMLQIEGPLAVVRPEIASKLNMTQKQNQAVQITMMQLAQEVRMMLMAQAQANGGNGFGPGFMGAAGLPREAMNQLRGAASRQLGKILDPKQKFNFNKMLGEPFDLSKIDPELASPAPASASAATSSDSPASSKTEKSRGRRKGASATSKNSTPKAATDDEEKAKP